MKIKIFDTRNMNSMNNDIMSLENSINKFMKSGYMIYKIDIKPYTHREWTHYLGTVQYEED